MAVLDDYADLARSSADWGRITSIAEVEFFTEPIPLAEAPDRLARFDVLCTTRERMPFDAGLLAALPRLRMMTIIGTALDNLDLEAATEQGVLVVHPDFDRPRPRGGDPAAELAWALVLAAARRVGPAHAGILSGSWAVPAGMLLEGRCLGVLGLGRLGRRVARYGQAFGMEVIAWSENLTPEAAAAEGVERVSREELFARADVLSVHLQLSDRTRGLVGTADFERMRPGSLFVNTSRSAIVDTDALVAALRSGRLGGAGLDVFDEEPLPAGHPLRELPTVTLTPHLGYHVPEVLAGFYADLPEAIEAFAGGTPVRVVNPAALDHRRHPVS
ncbi:NAD(P)-dependent oxidoreductase [Streptomyces chartreusis]|uniref:NAD(P)-dependent oxidoreductase n=1 Tax=Streptomyces chartreusis TaxID=1969 RepID=UPI00363F649D